MTDRGMEVGNAQRDGLTGPASRSAWILLVFLSAAWAVNHVFGAFVSDRTLWLFVPFALLDLAAVVILFVPYRRLQMWAWWAVWLEVAAVASVVAWAEPAVGLWYGAVAVVMGIAQLVTLPRFRRVS